MRTTPVDVLLIGPTVRAAEASALLDRLRTDRSTSPNAAILLRRDADLPENEHFSGGHDAVIALRQSELFDAIARASRRKLADRVLHTISGVPERATRRERVLVAEDNAINEALIVAQLEHLGLLADVVNDGASAVAAAIEKRYDLIFMDCHMPEMDGLEAARRIRSSGQAGDVPIIAVTANVLPDYQKPCLAAGMNDFLGKPALIGPLSVIVDTWLPERPPERT
jgi:CheY-like chemotaxis protein